uniref:Uncharacterized protein n=1 Tax=Ixodes ricinus TaxID=34613 RepID=A0A6B0V0Z3_IXORI
MAAAALEVLSTVCACSRSSPLNLRGRLFALRALAALAPPRWGDFLGRPGPLRRGSAPGWSPETTPVSSERCFCRRGVLRGALGRRFTGSFSSLLSWPLLSPAEPGGLPGEGPLLLHQSDQARRVVGPSTRQSSLRESLDDESWLRLPLQQLPLADRWPLLPAPLPRRLRDELLDASSSLSLGFLSR